MQEYRTIPITKTDIVPTALRMRHEGRHLVMIHGYLDKDGSTHVSWDYAAFSKTLDPDKCFTFSTLII